MKTNSELVVGGKLGYNLEDCFCFFLGVYFGKEMEYLLLILMES